MSSRWIVITLPHKYNKTNKELYKEIIHPIIKKYNGSNAKCVYDTFTESEYKFKSFTDANNCVKELKKIFKKCEPVNEFPNIPRVMVMPDYYEKNGDRVIVLKLGR